MGRIAALAATGLTIAVAAAPARAEVPPLRLTVIDHGARSSMAPGGVPSLAPDRGFAGGSGGRTIVPSVEFLPGFRVGVGMYGPKRRKDPEHENIGPFKAKSRKAGLGLSLRF